MFRDGTLQRLTKDHSLVGELVRAGKLTEEQAEEHPQRSIITRALGPEPTVDVDTVSYSVREDDVLLLCSDGLTSMISEEQISEILGTPDSLDQKADRLIAAANNAGGRDNITVVLFRVEDVGGDAPIEAPTMVGERAATTVPSRDLDVPAPAVMRTTGATGTTAGKRRRRRHRQFACRWLGPRGDPPRTGSRRARVMPASGVTSSRLPRCWQR